MTWEFEAVRLKPPPISKRGTLPEVSELYAFVDSVETPRQVLSAPIVR